jgi:hypothetical protein
MMIQSSRIKGQRNKPLNERDLSFSGWSDSFIRSSSLPFEVGILVDEMLVLPSFCTNLPAQFPASEALGSGNELEAGAFQTVLLVPYFRIANCVGFTA